MSADHVKYFKFKNDITSSIFRWLVNGEADSGRIKCNALDEARTIWDEFDDPDEEEPGPDLKDELSSGLCNGVWKYIDDRLRGVLQNNWLFRCSMGSAHDTVDWDEVAEAILKHDDLWDEYLEEQDRRFCETPNGDDDDDDLEDELEEDEDELDLDPSAI